MIQAEQLRSVESPALAENRAGQVLAPDQSGYHKITRVESERLVALQEVVVTGIGVILPRCDNRATFWDQLRHGLTQLSIELDPEDHQPRPVGRIEEFSPVDYLSDIDVHLYRRCHREQLLYLCSVVQAAKDAGFQLSELAERRVGLFDGTSRGSMAYWYELVRDKAAKPGTRFSVRDISAAMPGQAVGIAAAILGTQGPTYTFNGTCAAGAISIGHAFREVQLGHVDVAFGSGHDSALIEPLFQMYRDAGLMSREGSDPSLAIRPYTGHCRNAFGEGAVTVVVESARHARQRGAEPLARIAGYNYGNGGEHPTDVDFTGEHPARLARELLAESRLELGAIDFVLGHGNGVRASDISELNYMKRLFGARTRSVPLISTKPVYGHTLGASSALNVAAAALMLHHENTIPTIGIDTEAVVHGFTHGERGGESRPLNAGLVVAYGIGGQNAVLALSRAGT
jgi:3-oxoacyl-[acyl-carrier-protein] synthase II